MKCTYIVKVISCFKYNIDYDDGKYNFDLYNYLVYFRLKKSNTVMNVSKIKKF